MNTSIRDSQCVFDIKVLTSTKEIAIGIILSHGISSFQEIEWDEHCVGLRIWTSPTLTRDSIQRWFQSLEVEVLHNTTMQGWTADRTTSTIVEGFELISAPTERASREAICLLNGVGFGWGEHPTTQLGLRYLRGRTAASFDELRVLDFGAGTGVLGFAALNLGAAHVDAVEIDSASLHTLSQNVAANCREGLMSVSTEINTPKYGLIMANVYANILFDMLPKLITRLDDHGALWVSGYRREAHTSLADLGRIHNARVVETDELNGWMSCQFETNENRENGG